MPQPQLAQSFVCSGISSPTGAVSLQVIGATGRTYIVQASTNLVQWIDLSTNAVVNGFINFSDASATNFPMRFYRTKLQ